MYVLQGGACFICRTPYDYDKLFVDHHHESGVVRHLLCPRCNILVGSLEKNRLLITVALQYIRDHTPE